MRTELTNGFGKVYLTIEYDPTGPWVYNNWIGYQTFAGIIVGADECLHPLRENNCAHLLNDNRQVIGPWDHAVKWIVTDWAPRATAQGLTHFANVVSPESLAALSAEAMQGGPERPPADAHVQQPWGGSGVASPGPARSISRVT
jgi:hypothetical protein